jgi:hypothetical protein
VIERLVRGVLGGAADVLGLVTHRVWRVGHVDAPLDYVPHEYCSWEHRFDDPQREYRTLYCAQHKVTCLREVLADLRPESKVRADFAEFQLAQGVAADELQVPSREITPQFRRSHALAPARVHRTGPMVDLDQPELLERLAAQHATLLAEHGMAYLNISEIRSKNRPVTQAISRDLYEQGVACILFRSNQDDERCLVLLEGHAHLETDGETISLTEDVPELIQVCSEYSLILKAAETAKPRRIPTIWRP